MKKLLINSWGLIILFCCFLVVSQAVSGATEWSFDPSLRIGSEYNTNIRTTTTKHDAVWGTSLAPKLDIKAKTRLSNTWIGAQLQYTKYTKNEVKNRNIQRFTILSRYQQTPRSKWELTGILFSDTTLTPVSGGSGSLPPGPGSAPGLSGVIPDPDQGADNDARRNRLRLMPSWSRSLTQRSYLVLDYTLYDVSYNGDTGLNTLVDNRTHSGRVALKRSMTQRTVAGISGGYAEYEAPDVNNKTKNYSATGTIEHDFTETLSGLLQAGMRYTEARIGSTDDNSTSPIYRASITQNIFEATSYQLLWQRRLLPSSTGSVLESDRFDLRFRHSIKPTLTFSLSGRYFKNETVGGGATSRRDRWYYVIRPMLTKNLTRQWRVDGAYRFTRQKRKTDSRSVNNNAVYLNVIYAW